MQSVQHITTDKEKLHIIFFEEEKIKGAFRKGGTQKWIKVSFMEREIEINPNHHLFSHQMIQIE